MLETRIDLDLKTDINTDITTSIIIVTFNAVNYLGACLDSLFEDLPSGCEVIVVDNASSDGTLELVKSRFPLVKFLHSDHNLGFAGGNNFGAQHAGGEYLVFLNPDTVVEPGWLDALLEPLETDPEVGLTTPQIVLLSDPTTINTCGNNVHLSGLTMCRGAGESRDAFSQAGEISAISGAAFAIRRDLFKNLGGFDLDYFLYMEDTDLSWRARLAGYRCLYVPGSVVRHDYYLRFGPHKTFYQERNRYLTLLKNLHWSSLFLLAPSLFLAELVTWGYVLARQRDQWADKLRAYAWIVQHWRLMMKKRRTTQALRARQDVDLLSGHTYRLDYEQTGPGYISDLAHRVFDPLFSALRRLALVMVRR